MARSLVDFKTHTEHQLLLKIRLFKNIRKTVLQTINLIIKAWFSCYRFAYLICNLFIYFTK